MENHPNNQDRLFLELGGSGLQFQMDCPNPWTDCRLLITLQETHDLDLLCNSKYAQVMYNASDVGVYAQIIN